jgi:hypothetical protein
MNPIEASEFFRINRAKIEDMAADAPQPTDFLAQCILAQLDLTPIRGLRHDTEADHGGD